MTFFYCLTTRFLLVFSIAGAVAPLQGMIDSEKSPISNHKNSDIFVELENATFTDALFVKNMIKVLPPELVRSTIRLYLDVLLKEASIAHKQRSLMTSQPYYSSYSSEEDSSDTPSLTLSVRHSTSENQPSDRLEVTSLWPYMQEKVESLVGLDDHFLKIAIDELYELFQRTYSPVHLVADLSILPVAVKFLQEICKDSSADLINKSTLGENPLTASVQKGSFIATKSLIEAGALLDPAETLYSPLIHSIYYEDYTIAAYLLHKKAKINVQTKNTHNTPLHIALEADNKELQDLLLRYNPDTEITNKYKQTPLLIAIGKANSKMVELLLAHGANANYTNAFNESALHVACSELCQAGLLRNSCVAGVLIYEDISLEEASRTYNELKIIVRLLIDNSTTELSLADTVAINVKLNRYSEELGDPSLKIIAEKAKKKTYSSQPPLITQESWSPKRGCTQ